MYITKILLAAKTKKKKDLESQCKLSGMKISTSDTKCSLCYLCVQVQCLQCLISGGCDLTLPDDSCDTPLHVAKVYGQRECIDLINERLDNQRTK